MGTGAVVGMVLAIVGGVTAINVLVWPAEKWLGNLVAMD